MTYWMTQKMGRKENILLNADGGTKPTRTWVMATRRSDKLIIFGEIRKITAIAHTCVAKSMGFLRDGKFRIINRNTKSHVPTLLYKM